MEAVEAVEVVEGRARCGVQGGDASIKVAVGRQMRGTHARAELNGRTGTVRGQLCAPQSWRAACGSLHGMF